MAELPLDAYYDLTQPSQVALSPDGDRVAFVTTEYDPEEDDPVPSLFVAPTDGSREPHRLTRRPGASSPTWGPDGERLAFLAARDADAATRVGRDEDDEGDAHEADDDEAADDGDAEGGTGMEEPASQVWLFDLGLGGDARQLTDFEEGVREFDWAPDGNRLVLSARDPEESEAAYLRNRRDGGPIETERLQHKLDGVGYLDTVTTYLFVTDVAAPGEPVDADDARRLDDAYGAGAFEGLGGLQPDWGASGRIAFVSCREERPDDTRIMDVLAVDPETGAVERLTDGDVQASGPTWCPDGERLAFVSGDPDNWYAPSEVFGYADGEYESLTADLDRTVARGGGPQWASDDELFVLVGDEGKTRPVRVDAADGGAERVFGAQGDDRAMLGLSVEGDAAAFRFSHPGEGDDLYSVAAEDLAAPAGTGVDPESLTRLTELNADLTDEHVMPEVTRVTYESDGWDVDGVVYHPPEFDPDDPDERPLVVAIHGGPVSYDEPAFAFTHAALTSRGYVVFRPNYRGGSSYGRAFAEELDGQWGTVEATDIANGVRELVARGWADEDRVFGYGFSYGGIAQGFLVTQYPDLLTAAAPEHGIYDLRSAFGTDDSHLWTEMEYDVPWEAPEELDAASAITDVENVETPLLVTAGAKDWRCPPTQSEQLYVSARKQGVDARLVIYPNEHHNIGTPDRAIHRLEEVLGWYRRHDPAVSEPVEDVHDRVSDEAADAVTEGS
ncbi:MAG: prolyl oligopeptidase family serine peptidase [Halolamina sp.]